MRRIIRRLLPARFKRFLRRLSRHWRMYRWRKGSTAAGTYDVVCFPIIDWTFRWQRPQQLLSQFANAGHRVFVFNIAELLPPGAKTHEIAPLRDNVWKVTLAPPAALPIYEGAFSAEITAWLGTMLDALRREEDIVCAVSLVQVATWCGVALHARERFGWKIVYDCMDEWSSFPGMSPNVLDAERRLVAEADVVTVSSRRLLEKWSGRNARVELVRNAADFAHFSGGAHQLWTAAAELPLSTAAAMPPQVRAVAAPPQSSAPLKTPVVGYFGAIAAWFDVELLARAAAARPQYSFVLIGGVFDVDVTPLKSLPNVQLLGQQPYARMPAYLRDFDVCIIPFVVDDITAATDPVKFYEYFAQGKPVVSTPMPELEPFAELLYFATDDFTEKLDAAIAENDERLRARRIEVARANTWPIRVEVMQNAIREAHPKASILIVSYDNSELTRGCIESVLDHSLHPNIEVIVVDNASTDGSAEMLAGWNDPRVRVLLNRENAGFAAANNQALALAAGTRIVLLNNDTVVPRGWLPRMLRHLENPAIGLVNAVTNFSGNESRIGVPYTTLEAMQPFAERYMREHEGQYFDIRVAAMYCVGMRRDVYERIGPLDAEFGLGMFEDDDYSHRARLAGLRVVCAEDVFVHHFGQASFAKLDAAAYDALWARNRAHFEEKWGVRWQPHELRP